MAVKKKPEDELSVAEAVDNISSMADLSADKATSSDVLKWLDYQNDAHTLRNIKQTFKVLHTYLSDIYKKDKTALNDKQVQKGLRSMMILAGEAAQKVDKYVPMNEHVSDLEEFRSLREFYDKKIVRKFEKKLDTQESWKITPIEEGDQGVDLDIEKRGLKDLEAVKNDRQYELLYITKEDGKLFFNRNVLRHIKLVSDFDLLVVGEGSDDPFIELQRLSSKDAFASATLIKEAVYDDMKAFLKQHARFRSSTFYTKLDSALYALTLAATPSNEKSARKNSTEYFKDFCLFLREAFSSVDYYKYVDENSEEIDSYIEELLSFGYELCANLISRVGARKEVVTFIHHLLSKSLEKGASRKEKVNSLWEKLLIEYDQIQEVLKKYPNGPLFKTLDVFTDRESYRKFEPFAQGNLPESLYKIKNDSLSIHVLRMPSPISQEVINKVEYTPIFEGFLGGLEPSSNVLYLNLQDRTSWQEIARCTALEELPKKARFSSLLQVYTITKDTSFYNQSEDYLDSPGAEDFMRLFLEQLKGKEDCGYYFPKNFPEALIEDFAKQAMQVIHKQFFAGREMLSRKNRLDFIEIFYFLFILKIIELTHPTHLCMSCKDSIDTGPSTYAAFYAFLRMCLSEEPFSKGEEGFITWMLFAPALLYRERMVHSNRCQRVLSALLQFESGLEVDRKDTLDAIQSLYDTPIFKHLKVSEEK